MDLSQVQAVRLADGRWRCRDAHLRCRPGLGELRQAIGRQQRVRLLLHRRRSPWILIVGVGVIALLLARGTIKRDSAPWPLILLAREPGLATLLMLLRLDPRTVGEAGRDRPRSGCRDVRRVHRRPRSALVGAFLNFTASGRQPGRPHRHGQAEGRVRWRPQRGAAATSSADRRRPVTPAGAADGATAASRRAPDHLRHRRRHPDRRVDAWLRASRRSPPSARRPRSG